MKIDQDKLDIIEQYYIKHINFCKRCGGMKKGNAKARIEDGKVIVERTYTTDTVLDKHQISHILGIMKRDSKQE